MDKTAICRLLRVDWDTVGRMITRVMETGLDPKHLDNLFEIGASSLKLIEIHETIDREFPGLIDLTELFDFPTIAQLAQHLQAKLV